MAIPTHRSLLAGGATILYGVQTEHQQRGNTEAMGLRSDGLRALERMELSDPTPSPLEENAFISPQSFALADIVYPKGAQILSELHSEETGRRRKAEETLLRRQQALTWAGAICAAIVIVAPALSLTQLFVAVVKAELVPDLLGLYPLCLAICAVKAYLFLFSFQKRLAAEMGQMPHTPLALLPDEACPYGMRATAPCPPGTDQAGNGLAPWAVGVGQPDVLTPRNWD